MTDDRHTDPVLGRPTNRREFLVASGTSLAAVSLLGLSACGGSGSEGDDGLTLSASPDTEAIVKKQLSRFNSQSGGAEATLELAPMDSSQYFSQLRNQFQAGGTDVSVIAGDIIWPPQFASNGWISDLSDRFTDQDAYLPGPIEGNTFEGSIWGVPWFTDTGFLYYRSDLLEQSGYSEPPATWPELMEMAARITQDAGTENGFVFTGAQYEGGSVLGIEFIRTAGGEVLDGDTVTVDTPEAVEGLAIQQSLVADGIAPEAVTSFKEDEASGAFLRGDSVFMRMWPYAYALLSDQSQSNLDPSQVGLTQVPVASKGIQPTNVGGGWNFFIDVSVSDQDAAWELIEFMSAPEQQKQMALEGSYLPTRSELYDDEEIRRAMPAVRLGRDAIANTRTPPVTPYYSDMSLVMSEQFNANISGDAPSEEIAGTLQTELESIVSQGG